MLTDADKEWIDRQIVYRAADGYSDFMRVALDSFPMLPVDQCELGRAFQKAVNRAVQRRIEQVLDSLGVDRSTVPSWDHVDLVVEVNT